MDLALIGARIVQFTAAPILFGAPLFLLYALRPADRAVLAWARPVAMVASAALLAGSVAAFLAQTAIMAGDPAAALDPAILSSVGTQTGFGAATLVRAALAAAALMLCLARRPGTGLWLGLSALGAAAMASFAWSGHAAATEGRGAAVHLTADVLHLLAAGVWLGALAALAMLLRPSRRPVEAGAVRALHDALAGFSGIGSAVVAAILLTGLVNSWLIIGPENALRAATSTYGVLLLMKLALFVGMLGLAAANRFRLTPRLGAALKGGEPGAALVELRRSVTLETAAGVVVLILVAVLGALSPPM